MNRCLMALLLFVSLPLCVTAQVYNPRANLTNATLQSAVDNALDGDTLCVSTGVFNEYVDIYSKELFLEGQYSNTFQGRNPAGKTIVQGVPTKGPVFIVDGSSVTFAALEITGGSMSTDGNGGGLRIQNGSSVTALNCRIYGNASMGFGGGVYVADSTAHFFNTPVYSNTALQGSILNGCGGGLAAGAGGYINLNTNSFVYRNSAVNRGGGIFIQNARLEVVHTAADITENQAPYGGGVAVTQGYFLVNNGADICNNTAGLMGGGIFLEGQSTGIVEGLGTSIGYNDPLLGPNQVTNGMGGGIFAFNAQLSILNQARVCHNNAHSHGGGIFLQSSTAKLDNAYVGYVTPVQYAQTNYAGQNGGGIHLNSSFLILTNASVIRGARASGSGGGLYATNSRIDLSWNTWIGDTNAYGVNIAGNYGGGISLHHSTLNADVVTFWHNRAGDGGGALHMVSRSYATGQVLYAKANAVDDIGFGGVLYAAGGSRFDFRNSSFNNNTSDYCGGALYFAGVFPGPTSTLHFCNLFGNKADRDGGAIYIGGPGVLEVIDGYMDWNTADADENNTGDGGVFYVAEMADLSIDAVNNWGARFNSAKNGGVFALEDEAAVYLTASDGAEIKADNNTAIGNGGCAYLPNGTATFEASGRALIEDNWAAGNGGGIYADGTHFVNLSFDGLTNRPVIAGNSASNMGGGIFMSGGIFTLNNADIGTAAKGNQTRIRYAAGGGAYVCGGATLFAQNAVFAGNTCDDAGAGLAVVEAGALIGAQFTAANRSLLPLSQFVGNISTGQSAAFGGGGLFVSEGVAYVEDTLFAGNTAHRGGGVYGGLSSFVALQNCVIASNKGLLADSIGSGMRLFSATSLVAHCTVALNANGGIEPNEFSALRMTNSIVYDNTRTNISAGHAVTYSDIGGGYPGTGNINADPRFYDSTNLDFRLLYGSPCTNAGTVMLVNHDCIDEERPLHGGYDMGAYEYNGAKMDSDRDTMIDDWEILHVLDPLNATDGGVDSDDDTYLNREEYIADTDPWSDTNYLHLVRISESNGVHATFESSIRRVYSLYACNQAITGAWTAVLAATNVYGNGGLLELTDGEAGATPRLYRIGVQVP